MNKRFLFSFIQIHRSFKSSWRFFLAAFFAPLFFVASFFPFAAYAAGRISAFTTHIELNQNGSAMVQEEIVYDFGEEKRHGIYRKIPLMYQRGDTGEDTEISISSISVTDGRGNLRQVSYDEGGNMVTLKIGDPDALITGHQLYVIRYTVWGAVNSSLQQDEFYWNVTGTDWAEPIDRARAEIVLPRELSETAVPFYCYAGYVGVTDSCMHKEAIHGKATGTVSMIRFEHNELIPHQGLTIAVGIPKGTMLFTQAEDNVKSEQLESLSFVPWWERPLFDFSIALPFIVFTVMFRMWFTRGRDPKGRGVIIPEYDVPDNLSPLESAALYHGKVTPQMISAAIIDLAERGYLRIERVKQKGIIFDSVDYRLDKLKKSYFELPEAEARIVDALFESGDRVFVSALKQKLSALPGDVASAVFRSLTTSGYFAENPEHVRGSYLLTGVLFVVVSFFVPVLKLGLFFSGLIIGGFGMIMPKVTLKGALLKEELEGFKEYLKVAEGARINFANAPEKNPQLFEKFLPYAMIFGVEEAWAEQFGEMYSEKESREGWYRGAGALNASLLTHELNAFTQSAGSAFAAAGGASGGGGFSGGGAGGGGGGSW